MRVIFVLIGLVAVTIGCKPKTIALSEEKVLQIANNGKFLRFSLTKSGGRQVIERQICSDKKCNHVEEKSGTYYDHLVVGLDASITHQLRLKDEFYNLEAGLFEARLAVNNPLLKDAKLSPIFFEVQKYSNAKKKVLDWLQDEFIFVNLEDKSEDLRMMGHLLNDGFERSDNWTNDVKIFLTRQDFATLQIEGNWFRRIFSSYREKTDSKFSRGVFVQNGSVVTGNAIKQGETTCHLFLGDNRLAVFHIKDDVIKLSLLFSKIRGGDQDRYAWMTFNLVKPQVGAELIDKSKSSLLGQCGILVKVDGDFPVWSNTKYPTVEGIRQVWRGTP